MDVCRVSQDEIKHDLAQSFVDEPEQLSEEAVNKAYLDKYFAFTGDLATTIADADLKQSSVVSKLAENLAHLADARNTMAPDQLDVVIDEIANSAKTIIESIEF